MATLVIHDLPESVELDRQAMAAITGGSMVQAHRSLFARRQSFVGFPRAAVSSIQSAAPFEQTHTGAPRADKTLLR